MSGHEMGMNSTLFSTSLEVQQITDAAKDLLFSFILILFIELSGYMLMWTSGKGGDGQVWRKVGGTYSSL